MPVANKFLNGVDVSRMEGTIEAVAAKPALGKFTPTVATPRRVNIPASWAVPSNGRSAASQSLLPAA